VCSNRFAASASQQLKRGTSQRHLAVSADDRTPDRPNI